MPDLTPQNFHVCKSAIAFEKTVMGSGGEYIVRYGRVFDRNVMYDWTCTCPASTYRKAKRCKHIRQVMASGEWCGWHQLVDGGEPKRDEDGVARCPKCGRETEVEPHGV